MINTPTISKDTTTPQEKEVVKNTHFIIRKYGVDPIEFVIFFAKRVSYEGAARHRPLFLSFFGVVRSEPPFVFAPLL